MPKSKPILVVRLNYHTPRGQVDAFTNSLREMLSDYHVISLATIQNEPVFEVYSVDEADEKKIEDLREELLEKFKEIQDEAQSD